MRHASYRPSDWLESCEVSQSRPRSVPSAILLVLVRVAARHPDTVAERAPLQQSQGRGHCVLSRPEVGRRASGEEGQPFRGGRNAGARSGSIGGVRSGGDSGGRGRVGRVEGRGGGGGVDIGCVVGLRVSWGREGEGRGGEDGRGASRSAEMSRNISLTLFHRSAHPLGHLLERAPFACHPANKTGGGRGGGGVKGGISMQKNRDWKNIMHAQTASPKRLHRQSGLCIPATSFFPFRRSCANSTEWRAT